MNNPKKRELSTSRKILFWGLTILFGLGFAAIALVFGLFVLDRFVPTGVDTYANDAEANEKTIRTLELHPFDGWHIQANYHHRGPMEYEHVEGDVDVRSGSYGYFTDIDLNNPPAKEKGEYRILLVGGSGAQGWGGSDNDHMFYKLLEKKLRDRTGRKIRVVNLAMAGSVSYQNFVALNRLGHQLDPDLILSYSGYNDFAWTLNANFETILWFDKLAALTMASGNYANPPALLKFSKIFPHILGGTKIGLLVRLGTQFDNYILQAKSHFRQISGIENFSRAELFERKVVPAYIHAIRSIKRDFTGIPIVVAWQAVVRADLESFAIARKLPHDFYAQFYRRARAGLEGYMNKQWRFVNLMDSFQSDEMDLNGPHLRNRAHEKVAQVLSDEIYEGFLKGRP